MPRRARMYLPDMPYHLVQRGNNREPCFFEPQNYQVYLDLWESLSKRYGVSVHGYCLMTNHIHFLVTPSDKWSISNTMKVVGSRYAQIVNRKFSRTGTLWEGRHRSSLVQSETHLLTCLRYIELNPVRAGMVTRPEEYRWSSFTVNAWGDKSWLTPHNEYLALGKEPIARYRAYRELFREHIDPADLHLIRKAAHYCQPIGDDRFKRFIENQHGLKPGQMHRGRPRKESLVKK